MDKKGQAAMEFLMTYGWAILAAVIAVGVLAYYGVFSPDRFVSASTVVSTPFSAIGGNISTAAVLIEIRNDGGEALNITGTTVTGCGTNNSVMTVSASALQAINVVCSSSLRAGDTFRGDITVNYRKLGSGSTVTLSSTGKITGKVA